MRIVLLDSYAAAASPRAIAVLLASMGVTHLAWRPAREPRAEQTLSNEIAFLHFAESTHVLAHEAGFVVAVPGGTQLPEGAPAVVVGACAGDHAVPLAELDSWTTIAAEAEPAGSTAGARATADVYLMDVRCRPRALPAGFHEAGRFPPYLIAARDR